MKFGDKKFWLSIMLIIGIFLFLYFLADLGKTSIQLIGQNFNFKFLGLYIFFTLFAFFPLTWRFQTIINAYNHKPSFWILLKQTISTYSLSYVTPAVRIGGEPLRAYMLKKECDVDLKTGSSAIILDKFVEFIGSLMLGVVGFFTLLLIPGISNALRALFIGVLVFCLSVTFLFYIRTINSKGSLSTLFKLARLHKIKNWHKFPIVLRDVEKMVEKFFKQHKKALFISFFFYFITGVIFFLEIKFLLLSFGISTSFIDLILIINIWGMVNFLPVPAGLGFLEATQSTLFSALKGDGSIGFAMSLLIRARSVFVVSLGFLLISQFSGKQIIKEYKQTVKKKNKL